MTQLTRASHIVIIINIANMLNDLWGLGCMPDMLTSHWDTSERSQLHNSDLREKVSVTSYAGYTTVCYSLCMIYL